MERERGQARIMETVFLILAILSLGFSIIGIGLGIAGTEGRTFGVAAGGMIGAAVFYGLYVALELARDTNEKVSALWRWGQGPGPAAEIPKCRMPGCQEPVYSSSTGLCRKHYESEFPET